MERKSEKVTGRICLSNNRTAASHSFVGGGGIFCVKCHIDEIMAAIFSRMLKKGSTGKKFAEKVDILIQGGGKI